MQRAQNSKRSIAEIALTRMCDAKASSSPEALALRIEELERELSKLKFGAPIVEKTQKEEIHELFSMSIKEKYPEQNKYNYYCYCW